MNVIGRTKKLPSPDADLEGLGRALVAMAEPTRRQILAVLSRERLNVGELTKRFSLSQPAISHHLKILADSGLLRRERQGRERVYRLDPRCCQGMSEQLKQFLSECCANAKCC